MDNEQIVFTPFFGRGELSVESFKISQYDTTYMLAAPRYYQFYASYIHPRMQMYKGWIDGFHNTEYGVLPTYFLQKVGTGIQSLLFSKPIVLNTEDRKTIEFIQSRDYKLSRFAPVAKEAFGLAIGGGTSLMKLNRDGSGRLRFETLPMNRFFATVDAYGEIERVKCYVATYHDTTKDNSAEYYLCEERFFKYANIGTEVKRFPMVHYTMYRTSSNVSNEQVPHEEEIALMWSEVPQSVRRMLKRDYGNITVDALDAQKLKERNGGYGAKSTSEIYNNCTLLPFDDDLGCRLIKFTYGIPAFPKLPFGQPIADLLMNEAYQYDQLKFFERLEVYISRGRIMIGEAMTNPNDPDANKHAMDQVVFTYYDNLPSGMGGTKDNAPETLQPELRAEAIKAQKQNILNDTAFALGLSSSTIAAWLSDGTTQKTATEIEYERSKTETFIAEKIDLILEPLQELCDMYFHYYGLTTPSVNIVPTAQNVSDTIKLYSELYDKGQVTAKKLAEKILGTCSAKEVNELAEYIEGQTQKSAQAAQPPAPQPIREQALPPFGSEPGAVVPAEVIPKGRSEV